MFALRTSLTPSTNSKSTKHTLIEPRCIIPISDRKTKIECVCVVCVCVREEREREREREIEYIYIEEREIERERWERESVVCKERDRERERESVCYRNERDRVCALSTLALGSRAARLSVCARAIFSSRARALARSSFFRSLSLSPLERERGILEINNLCSFFSDSCCSSVRFSGWSVLWAPQRQHITVERWISSALVTAWMESELFPQWPCHTSL